MTSEPPPALQSRLDAGATVVAIGLMSAAMLAVGLDYWFVVWVLLSLAIAGTLLIALGYRSDGSTGVLARLRSDADD